MCLKIKLVGGLYKRKKISFNPYLANFFVLKMLSAYCLCCILHSNEL